MQRLYAIGLLCTGSLLAGSTPFWPMRIPAALQTPSVADLPEPATEVPVGGVILWWGEYTKGMEVVPGFEVCDGEFSPALGRRKPDLVGVFARGAGPDDRTVDDLQPGGRWPTETVTTEATALGLAQMPKHSHAVNDPGHAHPVSDPGHAHRLPMGDGDGGSRNKCADGDSRERRAVSSQAARTGIGVGSSRTGIRLGDAGGGEGHSHEIRMDRVEPRHQELFYIIRVR